MTVYPLTVILGLNSLSEPCFLVYDVATPELDAIFASVEFSKKDQQLIRKCTDNRKLRVRLMNESSNELVSSDLYSETTAHSRKRFPSC